MKTKNIKAMKSLINISKVRKSNYKKEFLHSIICSSISLKRCLMFLILFGISTLGAFSQNLNNPNKEGPLGTQVNTISGNLFIPFSIFSLPSQGLDIDISMHYNSYELNSDVGFGNGWDMTYCIQYRKDTSQNISIKWGDGREDEFTKISDGTFKSPAGFYNTLTEYVPGKYLLTELDGTKYYFDDAINGKVTKISDRFGNGLFFNYVGSLLTSIAHSNGLNVVLSYNNGRLVSIFDGIIVPYRTWNFAYSSDGNLLSITDPDNTHRQFTYLPNGPLKTISDKNENIVDIIYYPDYSTREVIGCNKRISFSYDSLYKKTVAIDHLENGENQISNYEYESVGKSLWITRVSGNCCGYNISFEYDAEGNKIKQIDANGGIYEFAYDEFGKMIQGKDPLNFINRVSYTSDFHLPQKYTDAKGNVTELQYNSTGSITKVLHPDGSEVHMLYNSTGDITKITDPKGQVTTITYDNYGNLSSINSPLSKNESMIYNRRGNLLSYTNARGKTIQYEYDLLGRVIKETNHAGKIKQMSYDAAGNLKTYRNENNQLSKFAFDASNRMVVLTDAKNNNYSITYDAMNNVLSKTDAAGSKMLFTYDKLNRVNSLTDALGYTANFTYDANGNNTSVKTPYGQNYSKTFDALNRVLKISDDKGELYSMVYDENNNLISRKNATGAITTYEYDSQNRLKKSTDALGNSVVSIYDNNGNLISLTDRQGKVSVYTYDALDRQISFKNRNNKTIITGYDLNDNVVSYKDENNNSTSFIYDDLDRRITTTYPNGKQLKTTYDDRGNITSIELQDGQIFNYNFDSVNYLIKKTAPGGETNFYSYNNIRRLISATNSAGPINFTYDKLGNQLSETFDGKTVGYAYDFINRNRTINYPSGHQQVLQYNVRGKLKSTLIDGVKTADFEYNDAQQLSDISLANSIKTKLQYDFGNRLSTINTDNNLAPNFSFGYNNLMLKTQRNKFNNPDSTEHYVFDDNQRLLSFKKGNIGSPSSSRSYQYDGVGNRIIFTKDGVNTSNTFNNANQLVSSATGANTINYSYDNRGNLTFDGKFFKTYNSENRLVKDSSSPSSVILYKYDAFGRRIKRIENNQGFTLTYDGLQLIEQRNFPTDTLMLSNFYSIASSPLMMMKPNLEKFYYHTDDLGSVASITNGNGALVEKYFYSPFGEQIIFTSSNNQIALSEIGNRYGFTGKEYDATTKTNHFMYREYDPATGRFLQRDPLGYKDGSGLYNYVKNNPVNYIDPYGLQKTGDDYASEAGNIASNSAFIFDEYASEKQNIKASELEYNQGKASELSKGSKGGYKGWKGRSELKVETNLKIKYLEEFLERNAKNIKNISKWADRLTYVDIVWKVYLYSKYKSECPGSDDDLLKQSIYFKDIMVSTAGLAGSGGLINLADYGVEKIFGMSATTAITTVTFHTNNWLDRSLTFDGVNYNPYSFIPTGMGRDYQKFEQHMSEARQEFQSNNYGSSSDYAPPPSYGPKN